MPDIWLERDVQGAQWSKHASAPAVQRYVAALDDDVKLWPGQTERLARRCVTSYEGIRWKNQRVPWEPWGMTCMQVS